MPRPRPRGARGTAAWALGIGLIASALPGAEVVAQPVSGERPSVFTRLEGPIDPGRLTAVGDILMFTARDEQGPRRLWRSDGTQEGTYSLEICTSPLVCSRPRRPEILTVVNNALLFHTAEGLWRSDGTNAGTYLLAKDDDERRGRITQRRAVGRFIHDDVCGWDVENDLAWIISSIDCSEPFPTRALTTDGTRQGTTVVTEPIQISAWRFEQPTVIDGRRHFLVREFVGPGRTVSVLWSTDGRPGGAREERRFRRTLERGGGTVRTQTSMLGVAGDRLLVDTVSPRHGSELWFHDPKRQEVGLLKDIRPGRRGSNAQRLTPIGERTAFRARPEQGPWRPFVSDGSPAGTVEVTGCCDSEDEPTRLNLKDLWAVGERLYLAARAVPWGTQLWVLEPGAMLATRLTDTRGAARRFEPLSRHAETGGMAFIVIDAEDGAALWITDGTPSGTQQISDLGSPERVDDCRWRESPSLGTLSFFLLPATAEQRCQLWRSDGTLEGTFVVRPPRPGAWDREWLLSSAQVGDELYILAGSAESRTVLIRTDGTREGTHDVEWQVGSRIVSAGDDLYARRNSGVAVLAGPQIAKVAAERVSTGPVLTDLGSTLPAAVGRQTARTRAMNGDEWLAQLDRSEPDQRTFADSLERFVSGLGAEPTDLEAVFAEYLPGRSRAAAVTALRVRGAKQRELVEAVVPFLFGDVVEPVRKRVEVAGQDIVRVTDRALPGAYAKHIVASGDTVWLIDADKRELEQIVAGLTLP